MIEAILFRLWGDWGHFKKPFSTSSPLTYSVPTFTALYGLIGGIMGWNRSEYLRRASELGLSFHIRVERIRKMKIGLLWASTKEGDTDYLKTGLMAYIDKKGGVKTSSARTMIALEVLREPSYIIGVISRDEGFIDELEERLREGRTHYTPYLGISEFIANLAFLERVALEPVDEPPEVWVQIAGVLPAKLVRATNFNYLTLERLPVIMDPDRVVRVFDDYLIAEGELDKYQLTVEPLRRGEEHYKLFRDGDVYMFFSGFWAWRDNS